MEEIYRHSTGKAVTLDLNATVVSAAMGRDLDNLTAVSVASVTAPNYWAASVPYSITRLDGDFYVEWTYTIAGDGYTRIDTHTVVTPLVLSYEMVGVEGGITQDDYDELEPIVRNFIQGYTNQYFGYTEGTKAFLGDGYDYLDLKYRLARLDSVGFNGETYEPAAYVVAMDGWRVERAPAVALTIKEAPPAGPVVNGVIVSPYSRAATTFWFNYEYLLTGGWGYTAVPVPVNQAAKLLLKDWSCLDASYRNKYLANFRAADWRVQFKDLAFLKTGNLTADRLLEKYERPAWEVI